MSPHKRARFLLVAVALAAAVALVSGEAAVAQGQQGPTELWEEYPLDPEQDGTQPGGDAPEPRNSRDEGAPAGGNDRAPAATDEDGFPLLALLVPLGLLLLAIVCDLGVLAVRRGVPGRLLGRAAATREASPREAQVEPRTERSTQRRKPRREPPAVPAAGKRGQAARKAPKPGKPAARKKPSRNKPAPKPQASAKPQAAKPRARKPAGAVKPQKPPRAAKPKPPTPKKPRAQRHPRAVERTPTFRTASRAVDERASKAAPEPTERKLTCSVFGWRDGRVADFYAVASGLQGRDWVVERSPQFEWLGGEIPAAAYEAHATLVDALLRAGWRPVGSEGAWYRQRFERPVAGAGSGG